MSVGDILMNVGWIISQKVHCLNNYKIRKKKELKAKPPDDVKTGQDA